MSRLTARGNANVGREDSAKHVGLDPAAGLLALTVVKEERGDSDGAENARGRGEKKDTGQNPVGRTRVGDDPEP